MKLITLYRMASPIYHSGFLKAANLHDGAQVTVFFKGPQQRNHNVWLKTKQMLTNERPDA